MEDIIEELKELVRNVNETLSCYDPGWSRIQRSPHGNRVEIETFRQFLECRFNREAFYSPSLKEYAEYFDGYLFEVTSVIGEDEKKCKFKEVCIELTKTWDNFQDLEMIDSLCFEDEDLKREKFWKVTDEVKNLIGGERIFFNNSVKKVKIRIE